MDLVGELSGTVGEDLSCRLAGFEGAVGGRLTSFGVGLSLLLVPLLLGRSREGRDVRVPSRVVAATRRVTGPVVAVEVLAPASGRTFSLFITSVSALPTERVMVKDSCFEREGRKGELEPPGDMLAWINLCLRV